jgi:hypothetical protein
MPRARTLAVLLLYACAGPATRDALRDRPEQRELFAGWATSSAVAFEQSLLELSGAPAAPWSAATRAELALALAGQDARALRAAVLLGHDPSAAADEVLLGRLEVRATAPSRPRDAADVVAAAALSGRGLERGVPRRLAALAVGPNPHPDLDVRVECAAAALWAGRDEVAPLLVRVLRALTPAERDDPPDWEPVRTLAWAKTRAAEALARRLGEPARFRPDGSWSHQMEEAARLEAALAALRDR